MQKLLIITLTLILIGCGSSDKKENANNEQSSVISQVEMQQVSSLLIKGFMSNLKSELMKGIKEGGFANAISTCQLKAPKISDDFSSQNWSIKRVTDKPRNQMNKANDHEQQILTLFADSLNKLKFFDEWNDTENKTDYYFYKPIYIGKFCLKCHGTQDKLDEKAAIALKEKYAEDKALEYSDGDLRGMFVVHIKSTDELALIQQALRDSL